MTKMRQIFSREIAKEAMLQAFTVSPPIPILVIKQQKSLSRLESLRPKLATKNCMETTKPTQAEAGDF